ncbi:hypothetical protein [Altererythrobacter xiamenensis]|nr:hypothetical protein [Altererythrobacter xiamenensis]
MLAAILEYRAEVQMVAAWVLCLCALKWGGGPERWVAIVWLSVFEIVHRGYHLLWEPVFRVDQFDTFHAAMDLAAGLGFLVIALQANRLFTLWIASFQLISFSAHLARGMVDEITPIAYAFLVIAPSYFQLAILGGGLIAHVRRKKEFGEYRDWRGSDYGAASPFAQRTR